MEIAVRFIGKTIIDMTIQSNETTVTEDITNAGGMVDEQFIQDLEDIIHDLKEHNKDFL